MNTNLNNIPLEIFLDYINEQTNLEWNIETLLTGLSLSGFYLYIDPNKEKLGCGYGYGYMWTYSTNDNHNLEYNHGYGNSNPRNGLGHGSIYTHKILSTGSGKNYNYF